MNADRLRDSRSPAELFDYGTCGIQHVRRVARFAMTRKLSVANPATDARSARRYIGGMSPDTLAKWVSEALKFAGLSQAELSRRLSKELRRDIDRAAVNKMMLIPLKGKERKRRRVRADEMVAIEKITGFPAPADTRSTLRTIPLLSKVTPGRLIATEQISAEDVERLMTFSDLPDGNWVGLRVEDDSMNRVAPPLSLILVNMSDKVLVNDKYYVFVTENGDVTFKLYRSNPDRLQPLSTNLDHETIFPGRTLTVVGRVYRAIINLA